MQPTLETRKVLEDTRVYQSVIQENLFANVELE